MRFKILSIAVAAALAVPAYAQMSNPPRPTAPIDRSASDANAAKSTHGSLDTNKDGFVSRDEARNSAELSRRFSELDKDNDGKLSPQELSAASANAGSSASPSTMSSDAPRPGANAGSTSSNSGPKPDTKRPY